MTPQELLQSLGFRFSDHRGHWLLKVKDSVEVCVWEHVVEGDSVWRGHVVWTYESDSLASVLKACFGDVDICIDRLLKDIESQQAKAQRRVDEYEEFAGKLQTAIASPLPEAVTRFLADLESTPTENHER